MTNEVRTILDLNDIVESAAPSLFPLAPVLMAVVVLCTLALFIGFVRAALLWKRNAYRREGLRQLESLSDAAGMMILLKRVALVQWPREIVAPLHGEAWIEFLNGSGRRCRFEAELEVESLRQQASLWIRFHRSAESC